jgi:hypothetical protein
VIAAQAGAANHGQSGATAHVSASHLLGLLGLAISGRQDTAGLLLLLVVGQFLWLAGNWHFALRHHAYKSPLAPRIFHQLLPRRLDPTRDRGIRTLNRNGRWACPPRAKLLARLGIASTRPA